MTASYQPQNDKYILVGINKGCSSGERPVGFIIFLLANPVFIVTCACEMSRKISILDENQVSG